MFSLLSYAGTLKLEWDPVTTDTEGAPISNLAGYYLFQSTSSLLGMTTQQAVVEPSISKIAILSPAISTVTSVSYSVTGLKEETTYFFRVTAFNTSGNESGFNVDNSNLDVEVSTFLPISTLPDATPPIVSNISSSSITSSSAALTWITNEPATSLVEYGLTTYYGSSTTLDSSLVTNHLVTLTGLAASTTYHYQVKSKDAAGNETISGDYSFTTNKETPNMDTTPPTGNVSINNGGNTTKTTLVTLTLSASDGGSGMGQGAQMQFSNDNVIWSTPEPYATTKNWILTTGNGTKTVYVKFKDAAGNWSNAVSDTIKLNVSSPSRPRRLRRSA